jgi:hypothetical protein
MPQHPQHSEVWHRDRDEGGRGAGLILALAASIGFWVAAALIVLWLLG